jgi:hypothetical protein
VVKKVVQDHLKKCTYAAAYAPARCVCINGGNKKKKRNAHMPQRMPPPGLFVGVCVVYVPLCPALLLVSSTRRPPCPPPVSLLSFDLPGCSPALSLMSCSSLSLPPTPLPPLPLPISLPFSLALYLAHLFSLFSLSLSLFFSLSLSLSLSRSLSLVRRMSGVCLDHVSWPTRARTQVSFVHTY